VFQGAVKGRKGSEVRLQKGVGYFLPALVVHLVCIPNVFFY